MRIAVVSESFLPTVNGVTNSVCHVLDFLAEHGHDALVICPGPAAPRSYAGFPVHALPAVPYRQFPVGLPSPQLQGLLSRFAPDVVHVASPFLLGAQAIAAANRVGIPAVAVYQTDVPGYARRNHLGITANLAWRFLRWVHEGAQLTLVPSSAAMADLTAAGIPRLARWGRGVDLRRYHPNNRRLAATTRLRERLSPDGEVVVGYVGRIAPEKQVDRLAVLRNLPGIRIAIVGDGPGELAVRKALRGADVSWLGRRGGAELAAAYACLDVFVHTGDQETFGQTLQEAHATGVPVVAPRAGGPIDLVDHGVNGFLFDTDRGMRDAVATLATDGALRARMGEAGRRTVLGKSWEHVCTELIGHYGDAIAAHTQALVSRRAPLAVAPRWARTPPR
jgi:phosphatidylinositol alpha 1,6-mannosyltransferase